MVFKFSCAQKSPGMLIKLEDRGPHPPIDFDSACLLGPRNLHLEVAVLSISERDGSCETLV